MPRICVMSMETKSAIDYLMRRAPEWSALEIACDPHAHIDAIYPRYSEVGFMQAIPVYVADGYTLLSTSDADYLYSGTLLTVYNDRMSDAVARANMITPDTYTAAWHEAYLRAILRDGRLALVHIMAGTSLGNGRAYQMYGFIRGSRRMAGK